MRVMVGLDSWCWALIVHIKKGARSVSEQHRSRPSRRDPDSRDQDFHPASQIRIVLEGFRREVTVSDLCRREGIKPGVFYACQGSFGKRRGCFMEAGKERLTRDTVRDATRQEIEHRKRENHDGRTTTEEPRRKNHDGRTTI